MFVTLFTHTHTHTHARAFNNEFVGFIIVYNINEFGMCVSTDTVFPYLMPCNLLV